MSTQVQRRKGTTVQHSTFTGASAELTVDTTKNTVVVHDGATAGGIPLAKETGSAISATTLGVTGVSTLTGGAVVQGLTVGRGAGAIATNTAVGFEAVNANTTGASNVGIGYQSATSNTSGNQNTALGVQALRSNTTASNNTAVGYQAGYSNTTADVNVFLGGRAGYTVSTGGGLTLLGYSAGTLATGTLNTFVGAYSGSAMTTGSKNTILGSYDGNQGGLDIRTASNFIVLSDGDGNVRGTFNSSGNLGIGTSSPDNKLTIGSGSINIFSGQSTADAYRFIGTQFGAGNTNNSAQVRFAIDGFDTYTRIAFATSNGPGTLSEKMRLDSSGNLGLGVAPSAWTSTWKVLEIGNKGNALTNNAVNSTGIASNAVLESGGWKYGATGAANFMAIGNGGGQYAWNIAPSGTAGAAITFTQAMTLDASGNLLVGTTSGTARLFVQKVSGSDGVVINGDSTSACLSIASNSSTMLAAYFGTSSGGAGSITCSGTTTLYNISSDYRLKNITGPITTSGAYIDSLKPVEGTWKADGSTFVGLIAHEMQEASRTTVATGTKDGDEMQGMDYSSAEIIANLIAELQSLRARVASLESK